MKAICKKLKQNKGFTISELLIATLILVLVSGMLTTCILLGMQQLDKETQESEAQMLCTMLSTAVQDELSYASSAEFTDTATGNFLSFEKSGKTEKVGYYIQMPTEDGTDVTYNAITDNETNAKSYLGKIYRASKNESGTVTNPESLVSDGAYNVKNATYGNLQAGMQLKETSGGYEVIIEVYDGQDTPKLLASKDFYVGLVATDLSANITPNNTEKYTIIFDANGGVFNNGDTKKTYENLAKGTVINVPEHPHRTDTNGVNFVRWDPIIATTTVTAVGNVTYKAVWNTFLAEFYNYAGTRVDTKNGEYNTTLIWPDTQYMASVNQDYYEVVGWTDTAGTEYYPANGDTWKFTKDEKFTAIYEPIPYTIQFYNGETEKVAERTATYDKSTNRFILNESVTGVTPTHNDTTNWSFKQWYLDREHPVSVTSGTAIPAADIGDALKNSTNRTIKLYAGYENLTTMYYKMDRLEDGNKILIVGGDLSTNTQNVMVRYEHLLSLDGIRDQSISTMGNANDSYILNSNSPGEDGEFYVSAGTGAYAGRHYISMKVGTSTVYLDLEFGTNNIQLKNSTDVRRWSYNNTNHELNGYWRREVFGYPIVEEFHYVYFDDDDFEVSGNTHSNGRTHIYEYKEIGEALSFNGIEP